MKYEKLFKEANVIDNKGNILRNVNIYVSSGIIEDVSDKCHEDAEEVIDCRGLFLTPGLVNLHAHSPMNIFKGIAEDVNIDDWFNKEIWPFESKITKEDVYTGSMLAALEMLNNGVTAFADHYFCAESIIEAVLRAGIKCDIAPTIFGMQENFLSQLDDASDLANRWKGKSNYIKVRMGPHSPYTCPPDTLKLIVERAKKLDVGIHIHVSETEDQVKNSIKLYEKTPFQMLNEAGGFELPVIIAHGLWVENEDLKLLNDNVYFATSPKTYMKLSMGEGNIWSVYKDIQLCIGTDGAASSNSLNPIEQIRLFALIGKYLKNLPEEYALKDIWTILMRGHEALDFKSGKIEAGFSADFVVWDLNKPNTMPLYNPLAAIIYSSDSSNVLHTVVNGEFRKKDGKLILDNKIDVSDVSYRCAEILKRGKGNTNIFF